MDLKFKTMVFKGSVTSVLLSGMFVLDLTEHEINLLEKCQMSMARGALAGLACEKGKRQESKSSEIQGSHK